MRAPSNQTLIPLNSPLRRTKEFGPQISVSGMSLTLAQTNITATLNLILRSYPQMKWFVILPLLLLLCFRWSLCALQPDGTLVRCTRQSFRCLIDGRSSCGFPPAVDMELSEGGTQVTIHPISDPDDDTLYYTGLMSKGTCR